MSCQVEKMATRYQPENEPVQPKNRQRYYSWSRPTREMRSRGEKSVFLKSEQCIRGEATIAFHPSGNWFQGNVISRSGDAYTIHGKGNRSTIYEDDIVHSSSRYRSSFAAVGSPAIRGSPGVGSSPRAGSSPHAGSSSFSSSAGSYGSSQHSSSPRDREDEESNCGSLDSELVARAMERLTFDLETDFTVTVIDYETGLNHTIKDVRCNVGGDTMVLDHSTSLSFTSTNYHKGNMADVIICSNLGPNLAEQGLSVFRGELTMTYEDEPCFPVSIDASQWCL